MLKHLNHKYEYSVNIEADTAAAYVISMVGNNKNVLEIGAGPGSITKYLSNFNNCNVIAVEIDHSAFPKLEKVCQKIYPLDLNDPSWPQKLAENKKFDVVVAADVLEHLYDPWATLQAMKSLLNDDGYVVLSLPHVGHSALSACLLEEDFDYREWGLLDKTHIRFFGIKNIQAMFERASLSITDVKFVIKKPEQTEFAGAWARLSGDTRKALCTNRFGNVYQVVAKARRARRSDEKGLNLWDVSVTPPATDAVRELKFSLKALFSRLRRNR
jgi:2-polyprenyl-3-methyl-5-hydroxy-6-metoxy-1,4-benzoquinol methylase